MWKKRNIWAIGGLREIGFQPNSDLLLVLSGQGRGIFDCIADKKIERDYYDYYMEDWDSKVGIVEGIGLLENKRIKCGGFEAPDVLKKETIDGWQVKVKKELRLNWEKKNQIAEVMFLQNSQTDKIIEVGTFYYGINRGYGFSDTGNVFVIGTSSDLHVWSRSNGI